MVNRCNLCKDSEESTDHILIHCDKMRELWTFFLAVFGLVCVFLTSMRNLLLQWKGKGLYKKKKNCLTVGTNLLILVYLERAQLKDF